MNRTTAFIGTLLLSSTMATPALAAHASRPASVSRADKSSPTNHPGVSSPGRLRFRRVLARIAERSCHLYARYRPLDPSGNYDPKKGMREFIVGTGGETLDTAVTTNNSRRPQRQPEFQRIESRGINRAVLGRDEPDSQSERVRVGFRVGTEGPCATDRSGFIQRQGRRHLPRSSQQVATGSSSPLSA